MIIENDSPVEENVWSSTPVMRVPRAEHGTTVAKVRNRVGGAMALCRLKAETYRWGSWRTPGVQTCRGGRPPVHNIDERCVEVNFCATVEWFPQSRICYVIYLEVALWVRRSIQRSAMSNKHMVW
jgi:hypothetical protein